MSTDNDRRQDMNDYDNDLWAQRSRQGLCVRCGGANSLAPHSQHCADCEAEFHERAEARKTEEAA